MNGNMDSVKELATLHDCGVIHANGKLQAFENTSTNIAAAQMRNSLTQLAETVKDPEQKKASCGQGDKNTQEHGAMG
jgi:hypothetical protein